MRVGRGAGVAAGGAAWPGIGLGPEVGLAIVLPVGPGAPEAPAGVAGGAGAGGVWADPALSVKPLIVLANWVLQTTGLGLPVVTAAAPLKATATTPAAAAQVTRADSTQGFLASRVGGRR